MRARSRRRPAGRRRVRGAAGYRHDDPQLGICLRRHDHGRADVGPARHLAPQRAAHAQDAARAGAVGHDDLDVALVVDARAHDKRGRAPGPSTTSRAPAATWPVAAAGSAAAGSRCAARRASCPTAAAPPRRRRLPGRAAGPGRSRRAPARPGARPADAARRVAAGRFFTEGGSAAFGAARFVARGGRCDAATSRSSGAVPRPRRLRDDVQSTRRARPSTRAVEPRCARRRHAVRKSKNDASAAPQLQQGTARVGERALINRRRRRRARCPRLNASTRPAARRAWAWGSQ